MDPITNQKMQPPYQKEERQGGSTRGHDLVFTK